MRKMLAILLILSLLLCGCSETDSSVRTSPVSEAPVASVSETPAEDSSIHADGPPDDPAELAKWVWAMVEEVSNGHTASDYDIIMKTEVDYNGTYTCSESNMRLKEIKSDTGPVIYCSVNTDGITSEIWYAEDTYYQSSPYGNYKIPMTQEDLLEQTDTSAAGDTILTLDLDNFGTCFASQQGDKYAVSFREPTLDTWMAFADMFTANGMEDSECVAFEMDGYLQCDLDGNVDRLEADMTVTLNQSGTPMTMMIQTVQYTNCYNDAVSIDVPSEDESFVVMNDPMIPELFFSGVPMSTSVSALDYLHTGTFTFSDNLSEEVVTQENRLTFRLSEQGLEADMGTLVTYSYDYLFERGSETTYWRTDSYRFGERTITAPDGTQTYTCTTEDYLSSALNLILVNMETYQYGSNLRLLEDGDKMKLVYVLSEDYAREVISYYTENYVPDYNLDNADTVVPSGVMTYWFDENGVMVEQELYCRAEAQFENQLFTILYQDSGVVLAKNDEVTVGDTAN